MDDENEQGEYVPTALYNPQEYQSWNPSPQHLYVPSNMFITLPCGPMELGKVIGWGSFSQVLESRFLTNPTTDMLTSQSNYSQWPYALKVVSDYPSALREKYAQYRMRESLGMDPHSSMTHQEFIRELHPFISHLLNETTVATGHRVLDYVITSTDPEVFYTYVPGEMNSMPRKVFLYHRAIGGDLFALLHTHLCRPMRIEEAIFYVAEISEALIWLHEAGIVHQDINLKNVIIREDGHIQVTDFGIAHVLPSNHGESFYTDLHNYSVHLAPEITHRLESLNLVWHAVDWYSLGVLFYCLLTMQPFVSTGIPPSSQRIPTIDLPGMTEASNKLLCRLLAPNPDIRLGGHRRFGGQPIFAHPGFIHPLIIGSRSTATTESRIDLHYLTGLRLPRSMKENLLLWNDRTGLEWYDRRIHNGQFDEVPRIIAPLRSEIRQKSLAPPLIPFIP